jgi:hypothetical protein
MLYCFLILACWGATALNPNRISIACAFGATTALALHAGLSALVSHAANNQGERDEY